MSGMSLYLVENLSLCSIYLCIYFYLFIVGLVTQRSWVRVSVLAEIVGGGSEGPALSSTLNTMTETLEQGTEPTTAPWAPQQKWLPTAPGVCSLCVCVCVCVCVCFLLTAVCVHLDGINAEHKFQVWSCTFVSFLFLFIRAKQLKYSLVQHVSFFFVIAVSLFQYLLFSAKSCPISNN